MLAVVPILLVVAAIALVSNRVRNAPSDPDVWHVEPTTSTNPSTPNWYRLVPADAAVERDPDRDGHPPIYDDRAERVARLFDRAAHADGRVEVLAGSYKDGWVTYVQRSYVFAFPDYVSVRFIDLPEGGSTLAIFSRSRYGRSDLGVNEKRVARWIDSATKLLL
ncbi:DUF1499 domain-containing protein [Ilumatobacter nonamiensis]|uniref:DUF1499 domain-containing protein n=1 Tax=Ilumatobacter nonamiensis TaxID=467093 RepID=UPI000345AD1E|nr:DUF1499 domain-containing protein [Ilumatobacter nonamiensis]